MHHSTGPRTPEGKQRSRLNALRHGLTGQTVVLPTDDLQAHQTFCDEFVVHYSPSGPVERQLVQTIADTSWRLNRISAMEHSSLSLAAAEKVDQALAADNPSAVACAQALAFGEQSEKMVKLSLYEQRLSRHLERSLKLIRGTQADRRPRENEQPAQKPQVKKPASAGEFVFSTPATSLVGRAPSRAPGPLAGLSTAPNPSPGYRSQSVAPASASHSRSGPVPPDGAISSRPAIVFCRASMGRYETSVVASLGLSFPPNQPVPPISRPQPQS